MGSIFARGALIAGVCLAVCIAGTTLAQDNTAPEPTTIAALPEGWDQVDQRLVFLTIELSSAENSLNAINKAITAAGYQEAVKSGKAEQYRMGNELMDRNGGGPISWQEFYGRTASQFYYHPSSSLHATIHGGRVSDAQIDAASNGGPLYSIARPPQLDYIYRANADDQARAEAEAAKLGQQIDKLLARRRELETEQSALWCKITFRAVSSQDVTDKPMYLFDPLATTGNGDQEKQEVAAIAAGRDFVRMVNLAVDQAQKSVDENQGAVYAELAQVVSLARQDLDKQLMRQSRLAFDLQDSHSALAQFAAASKRLEDSSDNMADSAKLIADSDAAGDEQRKSDFRGQLQQTLMDFASTTVTADQCLEDEATEWKVVPDTNHEAAELNLNWVEPQQAVGNSPPAPAPVVAPPAAQSPVVSPNYQPDVAAIAQERAHVQATNCQPLSATLYDSNLVLSAVDKPYGINGIYVPARTDGQALQINVEAGVEIRGGKINLHPAGKAKNSVMHLNGTKSKPIILRNMEIDQPLHSGFTADYVIFDQCTFRKAGGWFAYYSSKWEMGHCLFYKSDFVSFKGVDYGFKLTDCTFVGMTFPEITHRGDQDASFDYMTKLRKDWNILNGCSFVDCTVPPTVFWCSESSNYFNCTFLPGPAFKSDQATQIIAYIDGTKGESPEQISQGNPAVRAPLTITRSSEPFSVTRWSGDCPIPEVRMDQRYASVVLDSAENR